MQNSKKDQSSSDRGRPLVKLDSLEEWLKEQKKRGYENKVEMFANFIRSDYIITQRDCLVAKFIFVQQNLGRLGLDDDPGANAVLFSVGGVISKLEIANSDIKDYRDTDGNTILHLAVHNTYWNALIKFFNTIDVNDFSITNNSGKTPLDIASLDVLEGLKSSLERMKRPNHREEVNDRTSERGFDPDRLALLTLMLLRHGDPETLNRPIPTSANPRVDPVSSAARSQRNSNGCSIL